MAFRRSPQGSGYAFDDAVPKEITDLTLFHSQSLVGGGPKVETPYVLIYELANAPTKPADVMTQPTSKARNDVDVSTNAHAIVIDDDIDDNDIKYKAEDDGDDSDDDDDVDDKNDDDDKDDDVDEDVEYSYSDALNLTLDEVENSKLRYADLVRPLNPQDRAAVHQAWDVPEHSERVAVSLGAGAAGSSVDILDKHMWRHQRGWLFDESINTTFWLLQERDHRLCAADPSRRPCHFFSSFFFEKVHS